MKKDKRFSIRKAVFFPLLAIYLPKNVYSG